MLNSRTPQAQVLTVRDEQVTATPMTPAELATHAEHVNDVLDLPRDYTQPLRGWYIADARGERIGRVFSRGCVMAAEWWDGLEQADWLLAKWSCRRLVSAVAEILILRDEVVWRVGARARQVRAAA